MKKPIRFVILPKVAHPWFEEVYQGALEQAAALSRELGSSIEVDYMPPSVAAPEVQTALLEQARAGRPDGIALDPVETPDKMAVVRQIQKDGIPLVLFDAPSPDKSIPSIGTNFAQQGILAAERLLRLIDYTGKVAIMQGYPTAPNHKERYEAQRSVLNMHPGVTVVDGGVDNDVIETAYQQAMAVIEAHPDLNGYLCCDASGPIGIARAIRQTGKKGVIRFVAMDGIQPILEAIRAGLIESSAASMPRLQGAMSVLMLWQASLGLPIPPFIDTGVELITQENIDRYLHVG